jgi:hypothetical protein
VDAESARHPNGSTSPRAETSYLNTVGALLELLLTKGTTARGSFPSEAAVITAIRERHPKTPGLSQRALEERFAQATRILKGE